MQPTIRINIGLVTNEGNPLSFEAVSARLTQLGFSRLSCRIEQSSTEPTLVWSGSHVDGIANTQELLNSIHSLSSELRQDCIAITIDRPNYQISALVGPNAAKWGPFDPAHFII